jgi:hypothetical protein
MVLNNIDTKCAPSKDYKDGSCFTLDALKTIATNYNKRNKRDIIDINLSKDDLVKELSDRLSDKCSNQACWLRQDFVKEIDNEDIHNNTLLPEGPEGKYEWLSTTHINDKIEQYHSIYNDFNYLGTVPYDFEKLPVLGLHNIDFNEYINKGKHKFGMVINLDNHDEEGSHWVALYGNFKKNQIYFFDSVGKPPGRNIRKFITKMTKEMYNRKYNTNIKNLKVKDKLNSIKNLSHKEIKKILYNDTKLKNLVNGIDIRYNNVQHQFKNSECGVYSINFILRLLDGEIGRAHV